MTAKEKLEKLDEIKELIFKIDDNKLLLDSIVDEGGLLTPVLRESNRVCLYLIDELRDELKANGVVL